MLTTHITAKGVVFPIFKEISSRDMGKGHEQTVTKSDKI